MTTAIKGSLAITVVACVALFVLGLFGFLPANFVNGGWIKFLIAVIVLFLSAFILLYLSKGKKTSDDSINPPL